MTEVEATAPQDLDALLGRSLDDLTRDELISLVRHQLEAGVRINFSGKQNARRLARRVRPRVLKALPSLSVGEPEDQAKNLIMEGEALQAMVTLYKERGRVDLVLADPPYNTGKDFRYNDRWDEDPNDPDWGTLVTTEDGARHTKWMRFMWPRLQMARDMLNETGVLAICIDYREMFRLGQMLDELFGEQNRLGILNWQRTYTRTNDAEHLAVTTEYVLIYAKDAAKARTRLLSRAEVDADIAMVDHDPRPWTDKPASGSNAKNHKSMVYAIQSPFTGEWHYPPRGSAWRHEQSQNLAWLKGWNVKFELVDLDDAAYRAKHIGVPVSQVPAVKGIALAEPLESARRKAAKVYKTGPWPMFYFLKKGEGKPRLKKYLDEMKAGVVPTTFWANEDFEVPSVSWKHQESGHSQQGVDELTNIVGPGHDFKTVKPLKLIKRLIEIWSPETGLVLDPFAGSGTTAHAVLAVNQEADSDRRFILIEQGRPEAGDSYARTLTADRIKRAVTGNLASGQVDGLGSGFRFLSLAAKVDAGALLEMERDEMTDVVIASHFESGRRSSPGLVTMTTEGYEYLVARNADDEGFFLVWSGAGTTPVFDEDVYEAVVQEARKAGLRATYHVYARFNLFQSDDVIFYQIPDRILLDFGLSNASDAFNEALEVAEDVRLGAK